jgi:hypothetical protein
MSDELQRHSLDAARRSSLRAHLADLKREFDVLDRAAVRGNNEATQKELNEFFREIGYLLVCAREMEYQLFSDDVSKLERVSIPLWTILKIFNIGEPVELRDFYDWREFRDFVRTTSERIGFSPSRELESQLKTVQKQADWAKWTAIISAIAAVAAVIISILALLLKK